MRVRIAGRLSIGTLVLLAVVSGCGGSSTSVPVAPGPMGSSPGRVIDTAQLYGNDVYTAQLYGNDVAVYKRKGLQIVKLVKTLSNGLNQPQGTMTTANGWWYVANEGDSNVLIYRTKHSGPVGPKSSLSDANELPVNVSANPSRRLVAVSNKSTTSGGTGSVSVYLDRQAVPSRMLTYGRDVLQGQGIAISHQGDCYWSFYDSTAGSGSIVEFSGCRGNGTIVVSSLASPGGIAFDQSDNLYYADTKSGIYSCKKTSHCKLLTPTGSSSGSYELHQPININFDQHYKHLWVADAAGFIDAIDPRSGAIESQYSTGSKNPPFGIAPEPGS